MLAKFNKKSIPDRSGGHLGKEQRAQSAFMLEFFIDIRMGPLYLLPPPTSVIFLDEFLPEHPNVPALRRESGPS